MNKKIILILLSLALVICAIIAGVQVHNSKKDSGVAITTVTTTLAKSGTTSANVPANDSTALSTTNAGTSTSLQATTNGKTATSAKNSTTKKHTATTKKADKKTGTITTKKSNSVTVSINCKNAVNYGANAPNYYLNSAKFTLSGNDTAFSVLQNACKKNNIALDYTSSAYGVYVSKIGTLAEKDCGTQSGWMYRVNGKSPNVAASQYKLKTDDVLEWYYVTSPNDK